MPRALRTSPRAPPPYTPARSPQAARALLPAPAARLGAVRYLNLHEYQSKDLMESYNVIVQRGRMARTPEEAAAVAEEILKANPAAELILKAQIHAGGRGKGTFDNGFKGGVKVCQTAAQVKELAAKMLGAKLVTKQTGPEGQLCSKVLVNEGINIDKEFYFAILMDRKYGGPVLVASTEGGMDIEEVAEKNPEAIITEPVDIIKGLGDEQAAKLAERLGFKSWLAIDAAKQFKSLYKMFASTDATQVRATAARKRARARAQSPAPLPSAPPPTPAPFPPPPPLPPLQVEINPLAIGSVPGRKGSTSVFAVDAKLNFDDNAAFRQAPIYAQRDKSMEDARDVAAEEAGLNYVGLDGSIGCMVNGAGLAMATMDIIKLHGGSPANFLDVGGGATSAQVATALKILTSDPNVKAILVNIFGGIMRVRGLAGKRRAPCVHARVCVCVFSRSTHTLAARPTLHELHRHPLFSPPAVRHHCHGHRQRGEGCQAQGAPDCAPGGHQCGGGQGGAAQLGGADHRGVRPGRRGQARGCGRGEEIEAARFKYKMPLEYIFFQKSPAPKPAPL